MALLSLLALPKMYVPGIRGKLMPVLSTTSDIGPFVPTCACSATLVFSPPKPAFCETPPPAICVCKAGLSTNLPPINIEKGAENLHLGHLKSLPITAFGFCVFSVNDLRHPGQVILISFIVLNFYNHHVIIKLAIHLRMLLTVSNAYNACIDIIEQLASCHEIISILVRISSETF